MKSMYVALIKPNVCVHPNSLQIAVLAGTSTPITRNTLNKLIQKWSFNPFATTTSIHSNKPKPSYKSRMRCQLIPANYKMLLCATKSIAGLAHMNLQVCPCATLTARITESQQETQRMNTHLCITHDKHLRIMTPRNFRYMNARHNGKTPKHAATKSWWTTDLYSIQWNSQNQKWSKRAQVLPQNKM